MRGGLKIKLMKESYFFMFEDCKVTNVILFLYKQPL